MAGIHPSGLLQRFIEAATQQCDATEAGNSRAANRAYSKLLAVWQQLQAQQQTAELLPLLQHAAPCAKLWAASRLLHSCPDLAQSALQELAALPGITGFNAQMTLREWRAGQLAL